MNRILQRFVSIAVRSQNEWNSNVIRKPEISSFYLMRFASSSSDGVSGTADDNKKKKKIIPRITLISEGDNVEITTLEEAQKLSQRRNLKLVKIIDLDTKTQRPVYRLMSGSEYFAEELKQREEKKSKKDFIKGEKLLSVSARIASHDLSAKIKLVGKWVQKCYEVRVIITKDGGEATKLDQIAKELEKAGGQLGKITQKRVGNSDVRFTIVPLKKPEIDTAPTSDPASPTTSNDDKSQQKQQIRSYHSDS